MEEKQRVPIILILLGLFSFLIIACTVANYASTSTPTVASSTPTPTVFLTKEVPLSTSTPIVYGSCFVRTNGDILNFRIAPSMNAKIFAGLIEGSELHIIAKEESWYKVQFKDSVGYIYSEYCNKK